jgi:pimeloyl-ACP methyl ester carboxylesterase
MSPASLRPLGSTLGRLFPEFTASLVADLATRPRAARSHRLPPDAEALTLRFGLAGLRWGRTGPRVLALHGWQGHSAQFAAIASELVAQGLQVIALDAPAHGRSPGAYASPIAFSDALLESQPELGPVHAVIGHSMGGGAVLYALANGLSAARAVVVASPADYADVLRRQSQRLALPERAERAFVARMERLTGVPTTALDIGKLGARFKGELMVVHDRSDRVVPFADGERIARVASAPLYVTSGLGHGRVLQDPGVAATVARFIVDGVDTPASAGRVELH